jgi:hypothetical protein
LADLARELERIQTQAKRMLDLPFSVQLWVLSNLNDLLLLFSPQKQQEPRREELRIDTQGMQRSSRSNTNIPSDPTLQQDEPINFYQPDYHHNRQRFDEG